MNFEKVHSVAIYPAIGIARVGNSPDGYFLGATIPGQPATDTDDFRDKEGRIKRQAAKFYVYALDKEGNVLGELNADHDVEIDWRVDVANKKSAWYNFDISLDIPTAAGKYDLDGNPTPNGLPVLSQARNQEFVGEDRKQLMIEARAQRISGRNSNPDGTKYHLKGEIGQGKRRSEVFLGELRTDEQARLIFLGGKGHSGSFNGKRLSTFANNQGWFDDTSDGPVDASVKLPDGRVLHAEGAWVVTAPPNFAVGVQAFSTGYELITDLASRMHPQLIKKKPAFYADIYPVLKHLNINQWVNAGVSREFGWGSAYDFGDEALIAKLKDPSEANRPFRQTIFESFRNPDFKVMEPQAWPPLYGDAMTFNINSTNPRNWFAITTLKYNYLRQWAKGQFTIDDAPQSKTWEELSPTEQANGLTEAALEETLGGPFHPGCEFTWPMRHASMYKSDQPYRIKRRNNAKEDYGVAISQRIALAPGGPLDGSSPGDLTKWMAVPWQADTSSCLSAYRAFAGEYLPTFWPARVPNDVLTTEEYQRINSSSTSEEEKVIAFSPSSRKKWLRDYIYKEDGGFLYGTSIQERIKGVEKFVKDWGKIGIITKKEVTVKSPLVPEEVWVETGRSVQAEPPDPCDEPLVPMMELIKEDPDMKPSFKRPDWVKINPRLLR